MKTRINSIAIGLLMITLLISMQSAWAISGSGNGGKSVVCRDSTNKVVRAEMLDIYEGREIRGYSYTQINEDPILFVKERLSFLRTLGFSFYDDLELQVEQFEKQKHLVNGSLHDVQDSKHFYDPIHSPLPDVVCAVEQGAVRRDPEFAGDPEFIVSKEIYDSMDALNRTALALHEVFYKNTLYTGDSKLARYFVSTLLSFELKSKSIQDLVNIFSSMNYYTEYTNNNVGYALGNVDEKNSQLRQLNNICTKPYSVEFFNDGSVKKGCVIKDGPVSHNGQSYYVSAGPLEFYAPGLLKSALVYSRQNTNGGREPLVIQTDNGPWTLNSIQYDSESSPSIINFHPNGQIASGTIIDNENHIFQGQKFEVLAYTTFSDTRGRGFYNAFIVEFYDNGQPKVINVKAEDQILTLVSGEKFQLKTNKKYNVGYSIEFNQNGQVKNYSFMGVL